MDQALIDKFLEEVRQVQDKYGIYICADYIEDWDEDFDGNMHLIGAEACLMLEDSEGNFESLCTSKLDFKVE